MMKTARNTTPTAILAIFAMAMLLALVSCSTAILPEATVSVSGTGVVVLEADMVTFYVSVSESASTTGEAQQAANAKMAAALAILRENGVKDEDMSTASLSFSSEYSWDSGSREKVAEVVSQSVFVKLRDVDGFGALVDALGTVSGLSFNSVSFAASDTESAVRQARELAYQDAYAKASLYAAQAGMEVVGVVSIEDGRTSTDSGYSDNAYAKMAVAMEAATSTEAPVGQLSVSCEVEVSFTIR